jgi:hypothetical protein
MPHSASKRVAVEYTATEPMGGRQREQAITALSALITAWQHDQDQPVCAALLPLPGEASDTDHAPMTTRADRAANTGAGHETPGEPATRNSRPQR